jgi:hypothetical protein
MTFYVIRGSLLLAYAIMALFFLGPGGASALSDLVLAAVAGLVGCRYLIGYRIEDEARRQTDDRERARLNENAQTYYFFNTLQTRELLYSGLFGCALKILAVVATIPFVASSIPGV